MKKELPKIEPWHINIGVIIWIAAFAAAAMIAFGPFFNQPIHF